jgi:hypothetical protein
MCVDTHTDQVVLAAIGLRGDGTVLGYRGNGVYVFMSDDGDRWMDTSDAFPLIGYPKQAGLYVWLGTITIEWSEEMLTCGSDGAWSPATPDEIAELMGVQEPAIPELPDYESREDLIMITKVITGGQTGADQAGWRAARKADLATGGWMPPGFVTEAGSRPEFAQAYGAVPLPDGMSLADAYRERTSRNARDSDGTIFFGRGDSRGAIATRKACEHYAKPYLLIRPGTLNDGRVRQAADWCRTRGIGVLNVAGHRESGMPGVGLWTETFLAAMFAELQTPTSV